MKRIKIFGAGSIGNHFAHAARTLGWSVVVSDVSETALERMRSEIYPARYGCWDHRIELVTNERAPRGDFDLIVVGTPPESHLPLLLQSLHERPGAVLVEKPVCPPDLELAATAHRAASDAAVKVFVGYDHVVGRATQKAEEMLVSGAIGEILTIDVEFREHWAGIFKAHPWLNGAEDTYLGYWRRGGGASGEHSHAANLWQHFAHVVGAGRVRSVQPTLRYRTEGTACYDDLCLLNLTTEEGLVGRVVQDVVTQPSRKRARIQGSEGAIEWVNGYDATSDAVLVLRPGRSDEVHRLPKVRADDFIDELRHLDEQIEKDPCDSPIRFERGLDTMLVLAAAHVGEREGGMRVRIDYGRGYTMEAVAASQSPARHAREQAL